MPALTKAKHLMRAEKAKDTFRVADKLIPQAQADRRFGVLANYKKQHICLVIGPNKAGIDLEKNVDGLRTEERFCRWQQDIEATQQQIKSEGLFQNLPVGTSHLHGDREVSVRREAYA